ncbi:MAG: hypothetical protein WC974_08525 [Thermoplasmata archaeon]
MDISEQYIRMCEKAGEIQKVRTIYPSRYDEETVPHCGCSPTGDFAYTDINNGKFVWLPRQDQLAEMIGVVCMQDLYYKVTTLKEGKDVPFYAYNYYQDDHSIEQTLLRIVMKEKFNKTWNGEDWV